MKQSKINVTHLSKRNNATSRPIRALPVVLSTAGKLLRYLHGSYLLPDRNPSFQCFVSLIFSSFITCHLSLSIVDLLNRPVHSNRALSSLYQYKTRPLLLIGYKCVLGLGQTLWSKAFFKNRSVHV